MGFSVQIRTTIQGKHDGVRANSNIQYIWILQAKIDPKERLHLISTGSARGNPIKLVQVTIYFTKSQSFGKGAVLDGFGQFWPWVLAMLPLINYGLNTLLAIHVHILYSRRSDRNLEPSAILP